MYIKTVIKMNFVDISLNKKESLNGKTAFIPCPPNFKLKAFFFKLIQNIPRCGYARLQCIVHNRRG